MKDIKDLEAALSGEDVGMVVLFRGKDGVMDFWQCDWCNSGWNYKSFSENCLKDDCKIVLLESYIGDSLPQVSRDARREKILSAVKDLIEMGYSFGAPFPVVDAAKAVVKEFSKREEMERTIFASDTEPLVSVDLTRGVKGITFGRFRTVTINALGELTVEPRVGVLDPTPVSLSHKQMKMLVEVCERVGKILSFD